MGFKLDIFGDGQLDAEYLEWLVDEQSAAVGRHFSRLWDYYSNPMVDVAGGNAADRKISESGHPYVQAQEYGLPSRITGLVRSPQTGMFGSQVVRDIQRKEVVIENDIAWRINALADFLFGKPISLDLQGRRWPKTQRNRGDYKGGLCGQRRPWLLSGHGSARKRLRVRRLLPASLRHVVSLLPRTLPPFSSLRSTPC